MKRTSSFLISAFLLLIGFSICYADNVNFVSNIDINPNPMERNTTISITFVQKIYADIVIETGEGAVVKTLYSGDFDEGTYEFNWNRLDDNCNYTPSGKYIVRINYQARYTSTKKTIILK